MQREKKLIPNFLEHAIHLHMYQNYIGVDFFHCLFLFTHSTDLLQADQSRS